MLHELRSDSVARIEQQREHSLRQIFFADALDDCACDKLARAWMRRVRFEDDGISRCKRGRSVTTGNGECERKIAGAEHDDWADGMEHGTNVGLRERFAIRIRAIDASADPRTFFDDIREKSQLATSATGLGNEPRFGQSGFDMGAFDQRFRDGFYA